MSKTKADENVVVEYADLSGLLPWLTQLAFFLSVGLVIARCLTLESLRDVQPVTPGATASPAAPGPSTTFWLNLLCCVPAILILIRRAIDKTYYLHSSIAHILLGLVGVWAVVSTAWASDKYAAFINSSTLFASAALFWSATQLVRSWTRLRLLSGACFGIMLICCAQGLIYRYLDLPANIEEWKKIRSAELERRGWAEDSFIAKQFEQKLLHGEIVGFYASPNTMAAMMVFMGVVAAGVAIQRISNRDEPGWVGAMIPTALPAIWVIYLTQSKTAFATPVLAAIVLFLIPRFRNWMLGHRRAAFGGALALFVLGVLAVIGHGIYHHGLPTDSLNFRWRFWTGSLGVFKEHPLTGTGWSNFGNTYLAHRLPAASEEIKDPHNFIVRFFCELGVVGGALMLLMVFRAAWEMTASSTPPGSLKTKPGKGLRESAGQILPIIVFALVTDIIASVDFSQDGYWVFLELMRRVLWAGLLILAMALCTMRSSKDSSLDDRPAPWVLYGIIVGITIFLLHNLVDFSIFENGPMLITALLAGAVLGVRNAMAFGARTRSTRAMLAAGVTGITWAAVALLFALPIQEAQNTAKQADQHVRENNLKLAAARYQAAYYALWIRNTEYAHRAAEVSAELPDGDSVFQSMTAEAIAHNPRDTQTLRLRASYFIAHGESMNKGTQIDKDYKAILSNDPNNVQARLEYADFLASTFESQRAAEEYETALKFDDGLDAAEPKRLPVAKRDEIKKKIAAIRGE